MVDENTLDTLRQFKAYQSKIHGPRHWSHVALLGEKLAEQNNLDDSSKRCIKAFAWLHDLWREDDGPDREHGRMAAKMLRTLDCGLVCSLSESEKRLVERACMYHSDGYIAEEAYDLGLLEGIDMDEDVVITTVGCCWDADRLELLRLGCHPDPELMSTEYWDQLKLEARLLNKFG